MPDQPQQPDPRLSTLLAQAAAYAIQTAVETSYVHDIRIDADAGIYQVDCSGFVSFLVGKVGARHLEMIAGSTTGLRPLARDYHDFVAALPFTIQQGWLQLETLASLDAGDIVAWRLPNAETGDTGHVFIVAAPPVTVGEDGSQSVAAYDATSILHFDDSRGPGKPFATGIGTGAIHFQVDGDGRPTAFRFNARSSFETMPIAMARMEPFSAGQVSGPGSTGSG